MRKWTSVLAFAIAGALVATMTFAESSGNSAGNTTAPQMPGAKQPDARAPSASPATGADKSAPAASPSTSDSMKGGGMRAARGGDRDQVKAVQQALKDKGHDPGAIDGVMGPKTRSALRDFQKKEGIKDTGSLDQDTMSKLGVEARTSGTSGSSTGTSASPASTGTPSDSGSGSAGGSSPATPGAGGSGKKY